MKLFDFEDKPILAEAEIVEAPMNPTSFGKAIETGQAKGVLVGYEFEVCMPKSTIENTRLPAAQKNYTAIFNQILEGDEPFSYGQYEDTNELPIATFDKYFKVKPGKSQYESLTAVFKSLIPPMLVKAKRIFDRIPPNARKKYLNKISPSLKNTTDPVKQLDFVIQFSEELRDDWHSQQSSYHHGVDMRELTRELTQYDFLIRKMFGRGVIGNADNLIRDNFDYDPKEVIFKLFPNHKNGYYNEDEEDEYYDYSFSKPASILKSSLDALGYKTNIFTEYHQARKNLTDWYVEPDGSLEPNDDDGAAEVVTPPLPAKDSVEALKNFYALAKKLRLYTSKANHTGLHINVSIPETLDVMKLALFLGDKYILQVFDRTETEYAQSVIDSLTDRLADLQSSAVLRKTGTQAHKTFGVLGQRTRIDHAMLKRIVKGITDDHFASINDTGKYVSFRHVGGDYLNDYQGILNVVGRFVHAMIIASDPDMYKKEYLSKLVKLVKSTEQPSREEAPATLFRNTLTKIKTNGIPFFKIHVGSYNNRADLTRMLLNSMGGDLNRFLDRNDLSDGISRRNCISNSREAKQQLMTHAPNSAVKNILRASAIRNFATFKIVPGIDFLLKEKLDYPLPTTIQDITTDYGDRILGNAIIEASVLPPTSAEARTAFSLVMKAYIKWRKSTGQWKGSSNTTPNARAPRSRRLPNPPYF